LSVLQNAYLGTSVTAVEIRLRNLFSSVESVCIIEASWLMLLIAGIYSNVLSYSEPFFLFFA